MNDLKRTQVLVLGGGIAGLVAARELARDFDSIIVLEKSDQLGGSIGSSVIAGHRVDSGAEAFAVNRNDALALIDSLGLTDQLVSPARADARIRSGRDTYLIPHGILGIPSDLSDPSVLAAVGPHALAEAIELDAKPWDLVGSISIGNLVRTRLGNAFVERLLSPVVGGVHAANPDLLDADAIVPGLAAAAANAGSLTAAVSKMRTSASAARPGGAIMSLRGGMHTLVDALALDLTGHGVSILLSDGATTASYVQDLWHVSTTAGEEFTSEVLVVALPSEAAAHLFATDLSLTEPLSQVQTTDVAIVLLALRAPELAFAPLGSGVLITSDSEGVEAKASTHASAKWAWVGETFGETHLLRFSYGRDGRLPDDLLKLQELAVADAKVLYGLEAPEVIQARTILWPGALVQPGTGHLAVAKTLSQEVAGRKNLTIIGSGLGGNGITGTIRQAQEAVSELRVRYFERE
jgi:oxygen-dependent protoporphyrinogen oxidase